MSNVNRLSGTLKNRTYLSLIAILLIYLFLALYQLDTIPGAIWGDAIFHYGLVQKVLHGHLFFDYEYGGDGPVFTYLAVFLTNFVPLSFYSLKLTAVFIGFFFVLSMYFLTKEFFHNKTIALLATTISAISFWTIDFARQPHARILVPLFISLTLIYTLKKRNTIAGILLGIGMYTQASIWGMIFTYWRNIRTLLIGLVLTIPLVYSFIYNPVSFFSHGSYFGEKLAVHTPLLQAIMAIVHNIVANILSFNIKGDETFRMNIPGHPHLDTLSGILFDIGFLLILYRSIKKKQKIFLLYFILPFFFVQVPSFLDIHNYFVQPNISRMIGVIPFIYMSIAYSIFLLGEKTASKIQKQGVKKIIRYCLYGGILSIILLLNFYNYFIIYPKTLPNGNTPFAKNIARTIDTYPASTKVLIVGAGWGQYAQPEVAGIPILQQKDHPFEFFFQTVGQAQQLLCQTPEHGKQILLISDPNDQQQLHSTNLCMKKQKSHMLINNGWNIAYIISGKQ
ncbi:MAG TPA: hypothetical protein VND99_04350 [Candidatus Acidoferrales bacterium]|nr:hypothetical protein [Candidatus Acidoferrales bacterium]